MTDTESTETWLGKLREEDQHAAQKLWARYYQQLLGITRGKPPEERDGKVAVVSGRR